ncbi:DUF2306 domain-containing protein [Aquimarina muelleri]|uniref:DUF2306 domain-containing protein n=1 Tax=Aquimarina muelleri TaxID=279356 RepID=A0A918JSY6_9FLAO|nr:DUF2306 domain-containing protein [Aquimarina muelleri]MCX2761239.1 DUF2306 domain-containing protein [Aquimarina muelleri]GGX09292.1 hypothetical protein GCM10007384_08920 [Aquimarina muelleri]
MKKITTLIFSILSILIGLYPFLYFFIPRDFGLLESKSTELLADTLWNISFYSHIITGGIALLIGWIQFNERLRISRPIAHRWIGKIYVITVFISGVSGIYIGFFATGGSIASLGFISLGILWLYTTLKGYWYAKTAQIVQHQIMMYYSYAFCFAAVTLRIWLPILVILIHDFIIAYRIVAWLCWVPNLILIHYMIRIKSK